MVNREQFDQDLLNILSSEMSKKRFIKSIDSLMFDNHNMTPGTTNTLLNGNTENATIEELLWISQSIDVIVNGSELMKYFTSSEIAAYSKTKAKAPIEEKYPIVFEDVLQIASDQWVTTVSADKLFEFYKNQIINYNKNTQRPSVRKEKDGITEYKIFVNKDSINEISSLMKQGLFISNAISLNLNIDNPEVDFEYKNGTLTIYSGIMDIIDGYHRYQAMMKNKMEDATFKYTTILNIVNFDETKACTFIAQEDKRNKINKSVVRTMDMTNLINTAIQRLNDDSRCDLYGQIGRTETDKVNSIWLFDMINSCYKIKDRNQMIDLVKYLKEIFNTLIEDDLMKYDFVSLALIIKASAMYKNSNEYIEKIENIIKKRNSINEEKYKNKKVSKALLTEIENLGGIS